MARSGIWTRPRDQADQALPIDTALKILLEERSNVIARRDSINLTATALLGFGAVLIPVVASSKANQVFREFSLGFLLAGMVCMILCLLDWEISGSRYPRLQARCGQLLTRLRKIEGYCQEPADPAALASSENLPDGP
jgi:hypothetical protein